MLNINEATKDNCYGKCTSCSNTELPNIKDCKEIDIGYSYAYKTDCAGDRYIKAEEVKYLLKCERNKAIDDFKSRLEERILAGKMIDEKFAYIDNCDIDEIAEQLKAGDNNGT